MAQILRTTGFIILVALIAGSVAGAPEGATWVVYTHRAGDFVPTFYDTVGQAIDQRPCSLRSLPASWHVVATLEVDLTRDGVAECALLVWRPWEDWPIMRWSDSPSPIANNRDARGDSAHIILIDPSSQRELWAGSALAIPIVAMAAGDVDGDGGSELVALEGDYATGRHGPAQYVAVWRWNGFGFTLGWRSPPGRLAELLLSDVDDEGVLEILVR
jgi:hypothetical protein